MVDDQQQQQNQVIDQSQAQTSEPAQQNQEQQQSQPAQRTEGQMIPKQRFDQINGRYVQTRQELETTQGQLKALQSELESLKSAAKSTAQRDAIDDVLDELDDAKTPSEVAALKKELAELKNQLGFVRTHQERQQTVQLENYYNFAVPDAAKQYGISQDELVAALKQQPQSSHYWDDVHALAKDLSDGRNQIGKGWLKTAAEDELVALLQERGYSLQKAQQIADQQASGGAAKTKEEVAAKFPKSNAGPSGTMPPAPEQKKPAHAMTREERLADMQNYLKSRR